MGRTQDNRLRAYDDVENLLSVSYPNQTGSKAEVVNTYDKLDRLITEKSAGVTHSYGYDPARRDRNRVSTTYGGTGTALACTFDALNRLATCTETPGGGGADRVTSCLSDLNGNVVEKTLPNQVTEFTVRDAQGRTSSMTCKRADDTTITT